MAKTSVYLLNLILIIASCNLGSCTKSTDSDDDLTGNWIASSDFDGDARSEATSFTIGSKTYICTGTTSTERFTDLWEYDNNLKYWTQKANLPGVARNSAVSFVINGKGYLSTGYDGVNMLKDLWEYDPALNKWTKKADFPGSGRYDALGFSINNKGYLCSGFDGNYLKDLWEYDPASNAWIQKASLGGSKRSAAMSFTLNNVAYVVSGNNNGSALNDLWAYDPATDTWTQKRKITNVSDETFDDDYSSIARFNGVMFVMGSVAYLVTGESGSNLSTTWAYDVETDVWTQKSGFEGSARTGAVAFSLDDRGFVLTGRNGSLSYDNMYELKPFDELDTDD